MIVGTLGYILYYWIESFIFILPSGSTMDANILSSLVYFGSQLKYVDYFLPVSTLLHIMLFTASLLISVTGFRLVKFVFNLVRGSGA